jgi:hypothetical protein
VVELNAPIELPLVGGPTPLPLVCVEASPWWKGKLYMSPGLERDDERRLAPPVELATWTIAGADATAARR